MRNANHARGITLVEVVGCVVVVLILAAVLFPMFARRHYCSPQAPCQSSLKQIGVSFKTYLTDWDEQYPTNRRLLPSGKLSSVSNSVQLSPVGSYPDGKPYRGFYGTCWVEGLYRYMEPITTRDGASSVWKCPDADNDTYPATSKSAAVTYVFNRNLLEKPETCIRNSRTLMMAREVDRLVDSDLRPTNDSTTKDERPQCAFLTDSDRYLGQTKPKLHANGSQILFADGHVKLFDTKAFSSLKWDKKSKAWSNAGGSITVSP